MVIFNDGHETKQMIPEIRFAILDDNFRFIDIDVSDYYINIHFNI
jgi:hypothetical protein